MRSKKAIYNIISNIVFEILVVINGFIVPRIIIGQFGSEVNGLVSSITQFLSYIVLLESGFGPVVKSVLYKSIASKDKMEIENILKSAERFFRKIALIFIIYIIILAILYPFIVKDQFSYLYTLTLVVIISLSTLSEYFFGITYTLYLEADQKSYISYVIKMLTYVLNIILVVLFAKYIENIHLLKILTGILFIIRPMIQNIYVKRKYKLNFLDVDKNYSIKQKWDGLMQHIAYVVHSNTDIVLLTLFSNLNEVSVYSVYLLILKGIKSVVQAFSNGVSSIFGNMFANKERENILKKFEMYEVIYYLVISVIFSCTFVLTIPFVSIYTSGVNDINYIRPIFSILIITSELIWSIRLPHSTITLAVGHFKQTKKGALIEAILNILISLILVVKYGIIGVMIGTIVAMMCRTIELIYYSNKYILKRSIFMTLKKIFLIVINISLILLFDKLFFTFSITSYYEWIVSALIVFSVSSLISFLTMFVFYKKIIIEIFKNFKKILKR